MNFINQILSYLPRKNIPDFVCHSQQCIDYLMICQKLNYFQSQQAIKTLINIFYLNFTPSLQISSNYNLNLIKHLIVLKKPINELVRLLKPVKFLIIVLQEWTEGLVEIINQSNLDFQKDFQSGLNLILLFHMGIEQ